MKTQENPMTDNIDDTFLIAKDLKSILKKISHAVEGEEIYLVFISLAVSYLQSYKQFANAVSEEGHILPGNAVDFLNDIQKSYLKQ